MGLLKYSSHSVQNISCVNFDTNIMEKIKGRFVVRSLEKYVNYIDFS